jgi:hypothetical protein
VRYAEPDVNVPRTVGCAVLGRYGLGHSLLAWARCYLWSKRNGVEMLAPRWRYLRVGPYLRRETDKRQYQRLFHYSGYVRRIRRLAYLIAGLRVPIESFRAESVPAIRPRVVTFRNYRENNTRFFKELLGEHEALKRELLRVTREQYRPRRPPEPFIALHIRRGDFSEVSAGMLRAGHGNARVPLSWFIEILRGVRRGLGRDVPAVVFTDGTPELIATVLSEPAVSLAAGRTAIHDLLLMSEALVIVGSASGMTMWGSFLGQVPRISFPGQRKERLITIAAPTELEPEWESSEQVSPDFCEFLRRRIGA